jgi:hypothetical protein
MVSWFGGYKYPKNIPAGLVAIAVGMAIAWASNMFGLCALCRKLLLRHGGLLPRGAAATANDRSWHLAISL